MTSFFNRELRRGDHFVDIGANCGYFSLLAARRVGQEGAVISFEPQKKLAELLTKSFAINGFSSYSVVFPHAVGLEEGEGRLGHVGAYKGSSSLMSDFGDETKEADIVMVRALDVALSDASQSLGKAINPTVMKIDVEGYEYFVWKGMRETLFAPQLRTVLLEFAPDRYDAQGQDPEEFLNEMKLAGFRISYLDHESMERPLDARAYANQIADFAYLDLVLRRN